MAHDTIFALSTPLARSAVAVIRLSGPSSLAALEKLTGKKDFKPNMATLCTFRDQGGQPIDQGLALYFKAPKSFTGEDCAELHLHGSLASIRHMIAVLATLPGLRLADPGEFTRRAYLNGKMDLLEAEGLADLIAADTKAQKTQAMLQLLGGGSQYYAELRERIIKILAHLEAYIDFPEEEIPESVLTGLKGQIEDMCLLIEKTLADNHQGEKLREGFNVAIIGAPNAGKSSLLNRLSGKDAAIVSHIAGTTRDVIEVSMDLNGFPVTLMDTAGIRESTNWIEEEGVRRARARAENADLRLVVIDPSNTSNTDNNINKIVQNGDIYVITKMDLVDCEPIMQTNNRILYVSSMSGQGIDELLQAICEVVSDSFGSKEISVITRTRHRQLLEQTRAHLKNYNFELPLELGCEELRQAAVAIGKITGVIETDELLDVIFGQFCIGK